MWASWGGFCAALHKLLRAGESLSLPFLIACGLEDGVQP